MTTVLTITCIAIVVGIVIYFIKDLAETVDSVYNLDNHATYFLNKEHVFYDVHSNELRVVVLTVNNYRNFFNSNSLVYVGEL